MLAPTAWLWALVPLVALLVVVSLPSPSRRHLFGFGLVTVSLLSLFYATLGPAPDDLLLGPIGVSFADLSSGALIGLRFAALMAFFAVGARWLPAADLLPYVARSGVVSYVAGSLLRFVPTLRADAQRLRDAQAARGHRFRGGWRGARTWLPLLVPLVVSVVRRAREQSIALHLAGLLPDRAGTRRPGRRAQRWATVAALAALAIAGRLALVAWPGVSLSFFVVFVAGVAFGPVVGLLVGLVERLATDLLLSGIHPIFLAMAPVEAILGFAAGVAGKLVNFGQGRREPFAYAAALAAWAGAAMTLLFSVCADTATWVLARSLLPAVAGAAIDATWAVYVLAGLLFNVPSLVFNAVLFATATYPTLRALRQSGLLGAELHRARAPA